MEAPEGFDPSCAPTTLACVWSGQADSKQIRVKRGSYADPGRPGGGSCSSSFDPQALFHQMMSRNEELSGENRILKRQVEDLTAECAEKDAIIESLKARLEDAGVEPFFLQARLPQSLPQGPAQARPLTVRGCRRRCGSRAMGPSEGHWRSSGREALGIDATSPSIHVPTTPRAKPACAVPGATASSAPRAPGKDGGDR